MLLEETEICWTCDSIPTDDFVSCVAAEEPEAAVALVPVDVNLGAERDLCFER